MLEPHITLPIHAVEAAIVAIVLVWCSYGASPFVRWSLRLSATMAAGYSIGIATFMATGNLETWRTYVGPIYGFFVWPLGWPVLIGIAGRRTRLKLARRQLALAHDLATRTSVLP